MGRKFSVIFNEQNAHRVETAAERLGVKPDSLCLHFILERLTELEEIARQNKKIKELNFA